MRISRNFALMFLVALIAVLAGCAREMPSDNSAIHLNPNMDDQPRYKTQGKSAFFADGSSMREPVAGTVARGQLNADMRLHTGLEANGDTVKVMPVPVTPELIARGKERYNIYCQPCHGQTGSDALKGIVVQRGMLPPPAYTEERLRLSPDGHFFNVITNGKGNMRPYKYQISVEDRWAIIAYLRVLQKSQFAPMEAVPMPERSKMSSAGSGGVQ